MPIILQEVILIQQEVMIRIQLPECAIDDVEVLIAEIVTNHLDVIVLCKLLPCLNDRGLVPAQTAQVDSTNILLIIHEEYSADDGVRVTVLEL
eukprot:CAMPEP_0115735730 /NCGR_PEP_ID=MMETSP0272-20121206/86880_1 /TAXON_ID=71861 /ORGANISM="Scrippsiella trochoidea, Strain CCMP3099" /LENGTH=92 /DNA_ID=CAMNT_0003179865 /DNA_START=378 /DNA_END=653 /DNA_ORIENTATION=+